MINKIGVDIVSNLRIRDMIHNEKMLKRLLSDEERQVFQQLGIEKRKVEYLAGRFTAKEALSKAIGKIGDLNYKDISVLNEEDGTPLIRSQSFSGKIHLSISHCDEYTVSMVILEDDVVR
jgi:holo-[acyl-carrier protein] synthase